MQISLPAIHVIGMGEVGRRLHAALAAAGARVLAVTREHGWDAAADPASPDLRLIAVREDDLDPVLTRLAGVPGERLIAVQNGWIGPLLRERGRVTRGLVWFTSKGEFFRVLRPSPFFGPWAAPIAAALECGGLPATACDDADLAGLDADKMAFNCVVGLPLAVRGVSLGEYLARHAEEARAVFEETLSVCCAAGGAKPAGGEWTRFLRDAEHLAWVRVGAAKSLELRNGAVQRLAAEHGLAAPATSRLLEAWASRQGA